MEKTQVAIKTILETHLPAELNSRETISGLPTVTLDNPGTYLINFDDFTQIPANKYPVVIILPGSTEPFPLQTTGYNSDDAHSLAVICLILDQDAEQLQRKRARYAEAIRAALKKHQTEEGLRGIEVERIAYDRTVRSDIDASKPYVSAVWVEIRAWRRLTL